jgi:hypothetical protein
VVIANGTWTYVAPIIPGAYAATALRAGISAAQWEQIIANHKDDQTSYAKYLGAQEAGKELILYDVGDDALAPLKKQYINFKHLCKKTVIKMMTSQKYDWSWGNCSLLQLQCYCYSNTVTVTGYSSLPIKTAQPWPYPSPSFASHYYY